MIENPAITPVLGVPFPGQLSEQARQQGVEVVFYRPGVMLDVHRPLRLRAALQAGLDVLRCGRRIRRFAREQHCDIVHSNSLKTHVLLGVVRMLGRRPRCVVHLHDIAYSRAEKAIWRLLRFCADRIVVVSRPCWPERRLPAKVTAVPNGLRVAAEAAPAHQRERPLRLGFVGRFHPNKSLEVLLDWFGAARTAGIDCRLILRGRSDPMSEDYWCSIQERMRTQGLEDGIICEGWKNGGNIYDGLDVALVPSRVPDPLPRVVMEAMGAGLPVVAYPSGGISTMIESGRTGYLARTPQEFVDALRCLTADRAVYERIRRAGFAFVKQELTMERFHSRMDALYEGLLRTG